MTRVEMTAKERRLSALTVDELHALASANDVEARSGLPRKELIDLLMSHRLSADAPAESVPEQRLDEVEQLEDLRQELRRLFH